jgi:hypothetical protein
MARPDRRDRDDDDDRPRKPRRRDDDDAPADRPRKASRRDEEPDDYDDVPADRPRKPRRAGGGEGLARVVPYRNRPALAAYYCGVFGLIPGLGLLLAPIAFILGIVGFAKARKDPKARGTGHAIAGIVLGIVDIPLWIVLWFTVLRPMTNPN